MTIKAGIQPLLQFDMNLTSCFLDALIAQQEERTGKNSFKREHVKAAQVDVLAFVEAIV